MLMSKSLISVLFLTSFVIVNLRATEIDMAKTANPEEIEQTGARVQELRKRDIKELLLFPFLKVGAQAKAAGQYYDEMPLRYSMLFENTIYIETFFFCVVVLYGILHLPFWATLYEKLKNSEVEPELQTAGPSKTEETEMDETNGKNENASDENSSQSDTSTEAL